MVAQELQTFLLSQGVPPSALGSGAFSDAAYSHPSEEWLYGPFTQAFSRYARGLGVDVYKPEANDCDDFSRRMVDFGQLVNSVTVNPRGGSPRALCIGTCSFIRTFPSDIHAVVASVVYHSSPAPTLVFLEPQKAARGENPKLTLTPEQIQSCLRVAF